MRIAIVGVVLVAVGCSDGQSGGTLPGSGGSSSGGSGPSAGGSSGASASGASGGSSDTGAGGSSGGSTQNSGGSLPAATCSRPESEKGQWAAIEPTNTIRKLAVDRNSGALYVWKSEGLLRSQDQGASFETVLASTDSQPDNGYGIVLDPADGGRVYLVMNGASSRMTLDGGATWTTASNTGLWASLDWSDPAVSTLFARNGGHAEWQKSVDAGQTWSALAVKGWTWTIGVFDANTWVTSDGNSPLDRTTDGGSTYGSTQGGVTPRSPVMQSVNGHGYFLTKNNELAMSTDKGATWTLKTLPGEMGYGPYFGTEESHVVVAGLTGFYESLDSGDTWEKVTDIPFIPDDVPTQGDHNGAGTAGYDPICDAFYFHTTGPNSGYTNSAEVFQR
jgi:hypothetical protein